MMTERMLPDKSARQARGMALEGREAMMLYVAEIGRNIVQLNKQVGLLQTVYTETEQLLREIEQEQHARKLD